MRATLQLAGFLAVLPFISATLAANVTGPPDPGPSPTIVRSVPLNNGKVYTYVGCRQFPSLQNERPLVESGKITVEKCMATCNADTQYHMMGGVCDNKCYCDSADRGNPTDDVNCRKPDYTCLGNPLEFCGSDKTLVLYTQAPK